MAARAVLSADAGLLVQISNFNGRTAQEGRTASQCQIWSKSVETRSRYGYLFDFSIWRPPAILDFSNFKFLTVGRLKMIELRRRAKFGRNRSKCGRDMASFRFFKMAAVRHLGFVICVFGPPTKGIWWSLSLCKIWRESMQ